MPTDRLQEYMMSMGIFRRDKISKNEVLKRAGLPSLKFILIQMNLLWLGHLERIDHERLLRQILYSQLQEGKWNQRRLRLRFKDTVKRNMKKMDIEKGTGKRRQKVEKAEGISLDLIVAPTDC